MFTTKVSVAERVQFIRLLATNPDAATMFYDESRYFMVEQFLHEANADNSDD
ncbi:hypothetical protein PR001_g27767 [Phytophthora rubi]|nr:hypothetical protein PR001_g27767 [Phytophthora rubi]